VSKSDDLERAFTTMAHDQAERSEGVPAGLSRVNDDNFVYACVSKSFGSSLQPGCLGTNDPYQFIN
jgi:hypothetical protein